MAFAAILGNLGSWTRWLGRESGQLASVLYRVPTGRLVVLGEPGAGKTMLMVRLVLDMLGRRTSGGPVPFLASVASWDPTAQDLRGWLRTQLLTDHPALASHPLEGTTEPTQVADLVQNEEWRDVRMGSPATDLLPAGPGGETLACPQCALYLVTGGERRLALLIQAAGPEVHVDAACADVGRARQVIDQIRRLALERNVFRGHVIGFGGEVFGPRRQELLSFLERPEVGREQVILPPDLLERIERQVVGVARHVSSLRASGQHLKRGVLLHGPPVIHGT